MAPRQRRNRVREGVRNRPSVASKSCGYRITKSMEFTVQPLETHRPSPGEKIGSKSHSEDPAVETTLSQELRQKLRRAATGAHTEKTLRSRGQRRSEGCDKAPA